MLRQQAGKAIQPFAAAGQAEDVQQTGSPGECSDQSVATPARNDMHVHMGHVLIGFTAIVDHNIVRLHRQPGPFLSHDGAAGQIHQMIAQWAVQLLQQGGMLFGNHQAMGFADRKQIQNDHGPLILIDHAGWQFTVAYLAENALAHCSSATAICLRR